LRLAVIGWLVVRIRIAVCSLEPGHNDSHCKWADWPGPGNGFKTGVDGGSSTLRPWVTAASVS
jgi:hypothetical protein